MATWADLDQELDAWRAEGETPTFWWRDDDTQANSDDLERLIALSEKYHCPLHLAVIPVAIEDALAGRLARSKSVYVLQHGFAHINHEPKGSRASEVGEERDIALTEADLQTGWQCLLAAKLPNTLPVLVPPWNRIGDKVLPSLARLGYQAVSTFYVRPNPSPVNGLNHINCHIDPIRWKEGAKFAGDEKTLEQCVVHLRQRRLREIDPKEPTGFLTHHLQTDEPTWGFSATLLDRLTHKQASKWISLDTVLKGTAHG